MTLNYVTGSLKYFTPNPLEESFSWPRKLTGPRAVGGVSSPSKMPGFSFSLPAIVTCPIGAKLAQIPGTPCSGCYATKGRYQMPNVRDAAGRRYALAKQAASDPYYGAQWIKAFELFLDSERQRTVKKLHKLGKPSDESIRLYYAERAARARCGAGALRIIKGGAPIKETPKARAQAAAFSEALAAVEKLKHDDKPEARRVAAWVAHDNASHFRWHDSGDLFSYEYLELIVRVAALTPQVRHWLPTQERAKIKRHIREHGPLPENLTVRISSPRVDVHPMPKGDDLQASSVAIDGKGPGNTCPAYTRGGICGPCRACWDSSVNLVTYPVH